MRYRHPSKKTKKEFTCILETSGKGTGHGLALGGKRIAWLRIAVLSLVLAVVSGPKLAAQEPVGSDFIQCSDGHYAYFHERNIEDRCLDCAQPVNRYSKDQDGTAHNSACGLWNSTQECIDRSHCPSIDKTDAKSYGVVLFDKLRQGHCHWMVVPLDPVIGVEDKINRETQTHNYWLCAWLAATKLIKPKIHHAEHIGLAANPPTHRTQHQLHIHIGRLPKDLRDTLKLSNIARYPEWTKIRIERVRKDCHVTFVTPGYYHQYPRGEFPAVFSVVSKAVQEHHMIDYGIIVAGQNTDEEAGFYICNCKGVAAEHALDYTCLHR